MTSRGKMQHTNHGGTVWVHNRYHTWLATVREVGGLYPLCGDLETLS